MTLPFTTISNKSSNSPWTECWLWGTGDLFGHAVQFFLSSQSSGSFTDPTPQGPGPKHTPVALPTRAPVAEPAPASTLSPIPKPGSALREPDQTRQHTQASPGWWPGLSAHPSALPQLPRCALGLGCRSFGHHMPRLHSSEATWVQISPTLNCWEPVPFLLLIPVRSCCSCRTLSSSESHTGMP